MTEVPGDSYDLVIIGAGPTGLFAAYYAGFRGLSMAVVDSLPEPGGQVTAMYPEKDIYDIAALPVVTGRDLIAGLVAQAGQYHPTYLLGQEAQDLSRRSEPDGRERLVVTTSRGAEVTCGAAYRNESGLRNFCLIFHR